MARILRGEKGWGLFPRLDLISAAIGGFGGYHIGKLSVAYNEKDLLRKERMVNTIRKEAAEALRDIELHEKKKDEILRELHRISHRQLQKERALQKLEEQLVQRERKVRSAEENLP